jgi:hypothetical protein
MKKSFILIVFLITSMILPAQESDKISSSDFHHYPDCQKILLFKTKDGRDTSFLQESYLFDERGNRIRKFEHHRSFNKEFKLYSYDEKNRLIKEAAFDTTYLKNVFRSFEINYYYNGKSHPDSLVSTSSYPAFNYLPLTEKSIAQNIKVFDDWVLEPFDSLKGSMGTTLQDGKLKSIIGTIKVKKEVVLDRMITYTSAVLKYTYNSQKKLIKEELPKLKENEFSGSCVFRYDKKGRVSEALFNYDQEGPSRKLDLKEDSLDKWRENHHTTYFEYHGNTITETDVSSYKISKLVCERNNEGQVLKTRCSVVWVENQFSGGKFIPADTQKVSSKEHFQFTENIRLYEYNHSGQIVKYSEHYYSNEHGEIHKFDSYKAFKYKDDRPLKLPESEYVDFEIWYHHFLMGETKFKWL